VHEGVEVKCGVESVGEVMEEVDLERLDANLWVGCVRVKEHRRSGAIVTFKLVLGWGRFD
jgi:hypothetical protein